MQYSAVAVLALAATASASYAYGNGTASVPVVYTTEVHTAYTTVCPAATQLTYNGITYTATASQTLTITNCPCTVVKPVYTTSAVAPTVSPVYPTANATSVAPVPTVPAGTGAAPTTTPAASSTPIPITGAANQVFAASGASLAGLLGLAAYLL